MFPAGRRRLRNTSRRYPDSSNNGADLVPSDDAVVQSVEGFLTLREAVSTRPEPQEWRARDIEWPSPKKQSSPGHGCYHVGGALTFFWQ